LVFIERENTSLREPAAIAEKCIATHNATNTDNREATSQTKPFINPRTIPMERRIPNIISMLLIRIKKEMIHISLLN
jgi:hypothetical protein